MVKKNKNRGEKEEKRRRLKIDKLSINKQTVRDLTRTEQKQVVGAEAGTRPLTIYWTCMR